MHYFSRRSMHYFIKFSLIHTFFKTGIVNIWGENQQFSKIASVTCLCMVLQIKKTCSEIDSDDNHQEKCTICLSEFEENEDVRYVVWHCTCLLLTRTPMLNKDSQALPF